MCFVNVRKYVDDAPHFQQVKLKTVTVHNFLYIYKNTFPVQPQKIMLFFSSLAPHQEKNTEKD